VRAAGAKALIVDIDLAQPAAARAVSPGAKWLTGSQLRMDGGEVKSV